MKLMVPCLQIITILRNSVIKDIEQVQLWCSHKIKTKFVEIPPP